MAGKSFIDQARESLDMEEDSHVFEDFLVSVEVECAKQRIVNAMRQGESCTYWAYTYDDYDHFTSIYIPGDGYSDGKRGREGFEVLRDCQLSTGFQINASDLASMLGRLVGKEPPRGKGNSVDYAYINKRLEQELVALGCKEVTCHIGPQTVHITKTYTRRGLFHDTQEKVTETATANKWMVYIAW